MTNNGNDPLLPTEENCAHHIEPPNELELNHAFTRKMNHLLCVMKVLQRFKALKARRQARLQGGTVTPSRAGSGANTPGFNPAEEKAKAEEIEALLAQRQQILGPSRHNGSSESSEKGQAQDVSDHEPLFLGIGTGSRDDFAMDEATPNIVADSPTAVSFNVYDKAYEEAVEERLKSNPASRPTLYLTRFVKEKDQLKHLESIIDGLDQPGSTTTGKLAELASKIGLSNPPESSEAPAKEASA